MKVTFYIPAVFHAEERGRRRHRRKRAKEVVHAGRRRSRGRAGSQSGGVRAFRSLLPRLSVDARKQVCAGLGDTLEEEWDELGVAVRERDLYTADRVTENLKWSYGAQQSCRIR